MECWARFLVSSVNIIHHIEIYFAFTKEYNLNGVVSTIFKNILHCMKLTHKNFVVRLLYVACYRNILTAVKLKHRK